MSLECHPIVERSRADLRNNYSDYRDLLRFDFWYSCAYCSIMEYEAMAIRFEIDHYFPQKNHPQLKNDYYNLMWSCEKCNGYKGGYDPDENAKLKENVVIKIDQESPEEHFKNTGVRLEPITHKGEFNIELLELNRLQLRRLRKIREQFWESKKIIAHGIQALSRIAIDKCKPTYRYQLLKMKKMLEERNIDFEDNLADILRAYAKSCFIDEDPEKMQNLKRRRDYLKKQKAIE